MAEAFRQASYNRSGTGNIMQTFIGPLVVFAVVIGAMALGVVLNGRALRGSCGGSEDSCTCSGVKRRRCELSKAARDSR